MKSYLQGLEGNTHKQNQILVPLLYRSG